MKSLAGMDVDSASVNPWGLDQDRRWGLLDSSGRNITAREHPGLLGLSAQALSETVVQLSDRDGGTISVDTGDSGENIRGDHSWHGTVVTAHADASRWLSDRVGLAVRLVWQPDPSLRPIAVDDGGEPGDVVSLADAAPLLMITESSLHQLDQWTDPRAERLDPVRFRPNVVIDGAEPFAEEKWTSVTIDAVRFRVTTICDRCVMTMIDPTTLLRGKEPLRLLAMHRRQNNKTWFGIRLTPQNPGRISVGNHVDVVVTELQVRRKSTV